jgi:hypothetical protein
MLFFPRGGEFGFVQGIKHHFVYHTYDRSIDGTILTFGCVARGAASHDQDSLAESGVDRIDGDQVAGLIFALRRNRLYDEELLALQARVLARRNHRADDASENHEGGKKFENLKFKISDLKLQTSNFKIEIRD